MMHFRLAAVRTTIEIALWRHGWAWPLAAVVALSTLATYMTVLQPGRQILGAAQIELAREQALLASPAKQSTSSQPQDSQQRLQALQTALQASDEPAELVRKMAALAQAEQINLAQGDYQQQTNASTGVTRIQISQPVRASYPQLRRYVEAVLVAIPNASLDQVLARRDNVGQAQAEARLKWSLWMYKAPAARPSHSGARMPRDTESESNEMLVGRDQWAAAPADTVSASASRDLFSTRNWNPPPPPPPPAAEAAAVAPTLPFAFLGKKLEGDIWEVYLNRGEQTFIVREGQTLDGIYRIDKIAPPSLALTYLPLGQSQTLQIGDSR
jgi:hypothetical protein